MRSVAIVYNMSNTEAVATRLRPDVKDQLARVAHEMGQSEAALARLAIHQFLDRYTGQSNKETYHYGS